MRTYIFSPGTISLAGRIAASTSRLARSDRASVSIMMGIVTAVLLGMAALGTEITLIHYKQRQMQAAADAAAMSALLALVKGVPADFTVEGRAVAASAGFLNGENGATVTINRPPLSGDHAGDANAVEAVIVQPQTLRLAGLFTDAAFNVNARAVALRGGGGGPGYCGLAIDDGTSTTVTINNGARVDFDDCGLAVNGTGGRALRVQGGARLNAKSVSVSGGTQVNNGGQINAQDGVDTYQPAVEDPYADVDLPAPGGCNNTNRTIGWANSVQTLTPGTYCNGLSIGNGARVHLTPGVYYMKSGSFNLGGGSTVTGTGVTIVLTRNTGGYATATIGNGSNIQLSAPTAGPSSGLLFYGDRDAPTNGQIQFNGGANMDFTGAMYFPRQTVVFSNGANLTGSCHQLIAWRIRFMGGARFGSACEGTGVSPIGGGNATVQLVE